MTESPRKIKLLIVVPTLECGGLERNVSILCNNIDTGRFDVTLAVLNNNRQFFPITNKQVNLLDLRIIHVRHSLLAIRRLSATIKPDVILSAANHLNLLLAIFRWMFPRHTRVIARESSIVSINTKHSKFSVVYDKLLKIFYRRIDLIVCQSRFMEDDLTKHYGISKDQIAVIYNPVGLLAAKPPGENGIVKLITVGRLSPEKGIDRLIKAVAYLSIPFEFTIIGEGAQRAELELLVNRLSLQDKIVFTGMKKDPFHEIESADLFLMGSHYEGFPNALLEATGSGIPVVAFKAPGGIAEVVMDGENGLLVNGDDPVAFASAIEKALVAGFNRASIRAATLKRFETAEIIKQWENLFQGRV